MKIYDIGMNCGGFTDRALSLFNDVEIIGLEPNPEMYNKLLEKYKDNINVTVLSSALSDKNEKKTFYLSTENWGSTLNEDWVDTSRFVDCFDKNRTIEVTTITLDFLMYVYGDPDIVKIDIEGHEYEGILGLTKKINKLCFEFAEEDPNVKRTCDYLHSLGYNNFGYIEGDEYLREPEYTTYNEFELFNSFNVNRKQMWGMIWVK
jgi:FkbM family methyltransferase